MSYPVVPHLDITVHIQKTNNTHSYHMRVTVNYLKDIYMMYVMYHWIM